ncbi:hypothetical protein CDD81_2528 [Ophiocordyceps australis]|uniref:Gag1-like clamp domain-containing protein n=1 Tax=Ophiocordyceps australis TaxID=1399860 RepID=A0A2C5YEL4_9HYPO|nr:hypothetical protein CDD81_2528 [Ophiocordyceps australis]
MMFHDLYKKPLSPLAKLRSHHSPPPAPQQEAPTASPEWATAEYADLLSRDKIKQKEAIKRYLSEKVKTDWHFTWPPSSGTPPPRGNGRCALAPSLSGAQDDATGQGVRRGRVQDETRHESAHEADQGSELQGLCLQDDDDDDDDASSNYSIVSEDTPHYRTRTDWSSDVADEQEKAEPQSLLSHHLRASSADASQARRARRRKELRQEVSWNEGLACFEARRQAWTGAKTVRIRSKPVSAPSTSPLSPRSPRRFFFRHSMSASPPYSSTLGASPDGSTTASDHSCAARDSEGLLRKQQTQSSSASDAVLGRAYTVDTVLPVGQPLLPPSNALRATISPAVYSSLYDKVVLNNQQPACPINLSDMLRSCVVGWKRDGEWPPRSSMAEGGATSKGKKRATIQGPEQIAGNVARRMSFGILGRDRDDESRTGKGIRRSLQRALGLSLVANGDEACSVNPKL